MPQIVTTFEGLSKSILIVDDDRIIVELLAVMFEKYGFIVFKAENGLDAWHLFNSEHIDVILTDILMPGLSCIHEAIYQPVPIIGGFDDNSFELILEWS